ncbi:MAG: hypothetical protein EOO81_13155 [Oxalobacteraceae bacterium]|nr:MAG: hypothetical protein EOO81_13155 [Oxalobacteraceae bacterium]
MLPVTPALLYRALLVQSAQWPAWAEGIFSELRFPDPQQTQAQRQQLTEACGADAAKTIAAQRKGKAVAYGAAKLAGRAG